VFYVGAYKMVAHPENNIEMSCCQGRFCYMKITFFVVLINVIGHRVVYELVE